MPLSTALPAVRRNLLRWYARHGRSSLPWRTLRTPYRTVVSEFMLVQTQVDRVIPAFDAFLERFPDFTSLAGASQADVLRQWRGLGYNSRAVRLQRLARTVVEEYGGRLPSDPEQLRALPGVGPYAVAAIRTFAFNIDDAPVDTNVRRIVHRLFFGVEIPPGAAREREIGVYARKLIPRGRAYEWNSALMDLGTEICTSRAPKCGTCPLRNHCVAAPVEARDLRSARNSRAKQRTGQREVAYEQSRRYARGRIVDLLRDLPAGRRISLLDLHAHCGGERSFEEFDEIVSALQREGLVSSDGWRIALPDGRMVES
jgi:A/G-specific adenine glycosylase